MGVTLDLPGVLTTSGSLYATKINASIQAAADALHTGGANGDKWTSASIGVDGNIAFNNYSVTSLKSSVFSQQSSIATANCLYVKTDGTLHFVNGSSVDIAITSGAGLNTAALITATWTQLALATNHTILPALNYTHFKVDTSAARAINLPSALGVAAGRFYVIQDVTGSAASFNITINRDGSDTIQGASAHIIDRNYGFAILVSDGVSSWSIVSPQNASSTVHGLVALTQDLDGISSAPTVKALTGAAGKVTLRSGTTTIEFDTATSLPKIQQAAASAGGTNLTVSAQSAGGSNNSGGDLYLMSGAETGSGTPGSVRLVAGATVLSLVSAGAFSSTRRFASLAGSPSTSADLPTGDGVVYIKESVTAPSSNPVGGGVLYVDGGALKYRGPGGTATILAAS